MTPELMKQGAQRVAATAPKAYPSAATESGGRDASYGRIHTPGEVDVSHGRILYLEDVSVSFDGFKAINKLSLDIAPGELRCIIGPNGAGKTTTLRTIMGLWQASQGTVNFNGHDITHMTTPDIASLNIAYVPENMGIFSDLTVEENMLLAARKASHAQQMDTERLAWIYAMFPAVEKFWHHPAGKLSGGQKQMLAVARILRTGAKLLLLDEISEGLAPVIVQALARMIVMLRERGYTVVMVEQNFRFAAPLADRFYVMEHGRIVEKFGASELEEKMPVLNNLLGV